MIYRIDIDSHELNRVEEMPEAEFVELNKSLNYIFRDENSDYKQLYGRKNILVDQEGLELLLSKNFHPVIKSIKSVVPKQVAHSGNYQDTFLPHIAYVHVPNLPLMQINEVKLLSEGCTDDLQSKLDDGWRIIAICPPNEQRRPDYILGRFIAK